MTVPVCQSATAFVLCIFIPCTMTSSQPAVNIHGGAYPQGLALKKCRIHDIVYANAGREKSGAISVSYAFKTNGNHAKM